MMKLNLQNLYRRTYATLGIELKKRDGFPQKRVAAAEGKLGYRLPAALRDYYLVAGREPWLNHCFNRLLAPGDLDVANGKLVFMEENQGVVVWGVAASSKASRDPAVYQGPIVDDEVSGWYRESGKCSAFLVFMLHLQAAYGGGMAFGASAPADKSIFKILDKSWRFAGEVNGMRAYNRNLQAICVCKWNDSALTGRAYRAFSGACEKADLENMACVLGLKWDSQFPEGK